MSSNKFGYVGYQNNPEQSFYNNKGIFSVNEIYDLAQENKWTNKQSYDLLVSYTLSGTENNIDLYFDTANYKVHRILINAESDASGQTYGYLRFIEGTTVISSSYNRAIQLARSSTDLKLDSQGTDNIFCGEFSVRKYVGFLDLYNLGDSTFYSTVRSQFAGGKLYLGGQQMTRASEVNGVRIWAYPESDSSANFVSGTQIRIYGLRP